MTTGFIPLVLIAAGMLCLVAAVRVLIHQRRIVEMVPYPDATVSLPARWDDAEITKLLQRHRDQPTVLAYAVESIKSRMILNQDVKTAQMRLKLITSVIDLFRLNKELQTVLHDLHLADKEFAIRQLEADIRLEDAEARQKSERRLRQLRQERDELQLKKDIAQTNKEIEGLVAPIAKLAEAASPEQQRGRERAACEARIQSLKQEKDRAQKIQDEAERAIKSNALDDALRREYERWAGLV
jgi:hypothetical protein